MPLSKNDSMGKWIDDFKKSDAPQFQGKSEKERRDMAIAARLSAMKEDVTEEKKGLWANIHAKRKRGEKPNPPGHPDRPTAQDFKDASKKESTDAYGKSLEKEKEKRLTTNDQNTLARLRTMMDKEKTKVPRKPKGEYDRKVGSYLKKKYNEEVELGEETTFEVEVEGLPTMYVKAKSPGEVKANLRKIVKQPSMITDVTRVTDADMKKIFRDKAQGREEVDEGMKPDRKAPGWMLRADPKLKAKVDANTAKHKEFKKLVGTKPKTEGFKQALRKYVPGYAKNQLNKKMDAQKYATGDSVKKTVDKDVNFARYKKVYDKLKEAECCSKCGKVHEGSCK